MNAERSIRKRSTGVTLLDVARESGVSDATVSRVLSGSNNVKESTRIRVMEAVQRLGYVANLPARSLAGGRSNVIGLLVPNFGDGYVSTIIGGIEQELARADYDLMIYTTRRHNDKESIYTATIAKGLAEGMLLIAPLVPMAYLDALRDQNFPYVLIDQADVTQNSAIVDATNWHGAYEATRYLIQLGHRRIAFILGLPDVSCAIERLAGFKSALVDSDIAFQEDLVIAGDFWQVRGYENTMLLLQSVRPMPTAIFASNDLMAFGAIDAIREAGLRVPEDISVIGFDDIPLASFGYPKLTTVRQPLEQMGRVAAKMLLEQIEGGTRHPRRVSLATQLVIRDTCAPPRPE